MTPSQCHERRKCPKSSTDAVKSRCRPIVRRARSHPLLNPASISTKRHARSAALCKAFLGARMLPVCACAFRLCTDTCAARGPRGCPHPTFPRRTTG
eukprot:5546848-Prymnesium_polylepis.2